MNSILNITRLENLTDFHPWDEGICLFSLEKQLRAQQQPINQANFIHEIYSIQPGKVSKKPLAKAESYKRD